jgi:DNA-nicking Smr family endonuclease
MTRRLTRDERKLWEGLRRSVRPLRPMPEPPADAPTLTEAAPGPATAATAKARRAVQPFAPVAAATPQAPPLLPLEEKVRRRLARGVVEADARIDLHGMNQERAFAALLSFLRRSQARGARLVLVITGKGRADDNGRGVLRQRVPAWLSRPEYRDLIVGFEEAGRRQGGGGALYVRLRRRRDMLGAEAGG